MRWAERQPPLRPHAASTGLLPKTTDAVMRAIETVLTEGPRTRDIGGRASTQELGKAIADAVAA